MKVERWSSSAPPDQATLRAALEADGYAVFEWTDGPGAVYPPHAHGDDQSHCVVRGALELTVAGEAHLLRPGDRDWLPAGTVHAARVVGAGPVTYLIGSRPVRP